MRSKELPEIIKTIDKNTETIYNGNFYKNQYHGFGFLRKEIKKENEQKIERITPSPGHRNPPPVPGGDHQTPNSKKEKEKKKREGEERDK